MASTFISMNIHYVFSTKNRQNLIDKEIRHRLWAYMGGVARQYNMVALAIGGTGDHVHVLLSIPATISPSKAIQLIKIGSSKWIHEEFPEKSSFAWQSGYAAFSVSLGRIAQTIEYINNQGQHHKKKTFEEEYLDFLKKTGIEFDEKYALG
jgi:putative transposase